MSDAPYPFRAAWVDPDFRPKHKPGCVHCARCGKVLKDRAKERSRFFPGMARAMAEQWGGFALEAVKCAA